MRQTTLLLTLLLALLSSVRAEPLRTVLNGLEIAVDRENRLPRAPGI